MSEEENHSYRCPVCGHSDGVQLKTGEVRRLACSHCQAPLELRLEADSSEPVSVSLIRGED